MIHSPSFTALLDANVLYPFRLRNFLLELAVLDLYKPKWTKSIHEEWIRNPLLKRTDLKRESLEKTRDAMDSAFPDSNIIHYEEIINSLSLPDQKDRHVLAAAVRANVDVLVTFNLKDFPAGYLKSYDIDVQHPDEFVTNLLSLNAENCREALNNQVEKLKNPPQSIEEVLQTLKKCGLTNSVSILRKLCVFR